MNRGRRQTLGNAILYLPLAGVAAYAAYLGVAAALAGLSAGDEDVLLTSDSGGPGWLIAVLGLLAVAAAGLLAWAGWQVTSGAAARWLLMLVGVLCVPALLVWVVGLASGGLMGLASVLTVAPYLLLLSLWRLRARRESEAVPPSAVR